MFFKSITLLGCFKDFEISSALALRSEIVVTKIN